MPIIQSRATGAARASSAASAAAAFSAGAAEESQALTQAVDYEEEASSLEEEPSELGRPPSFAAVVAAQASAQGGKVERELKKAKMMATAAMLVALLCVGPLAILASRLEVLSAAAAAGGSAASAAPRGVVSLDLEDFSGEDGLEGSEGEAKGWHRTYLKSRVRQSAELDSEELKVLPVGSLVWVAGTQGRRARILRPLVGWMSLRSADGVEILRPDQTYSAQLNSTRLDAMLRSRQLREENMKLQEAAAKMTQKQRELMDSLRQLRGSPVVKKVARGTQKAADLAGRKIAQAERAIGKSAGKVWKKSVKTQKANEFLKHTFH